MVLAVLLEHGDGVAEAEGEGQKEVPDGAAFADVGLLALVDDGVPISDITVVVAGPLAVVGRCWPGDAMLWEVVVCRASDDAVAYRVEVESGSVSVSTCLLTTPEGTTVGSVWYLTSNTPYPSSYPAICKHRVAGTRAW